MKTIATIAFAALLLALGLLGCNSSPVGSIYDDDYVAPVVVVTRVATVLKPVPVLATVIVTREVPIATRIIEKEVVVERPVYRTVIKEVPIGVRETVVVAATRTPVPPVEFFNSKTAVNLLYPNRDPNEKNRPYDRHNGWYFHLRLGEGTYMLSYGCTSQVDLRSVDGFFNSFDHRNIRLESLYRHGNIYNLVRSSKYRGALMMEVSDTQETILHSVNIGGGWGKSRDKLYNYLDGDVMLSGDYYLRVGSHCHYDYMKVTVCKVESREDLDDRCPWTGHGHDEVGE